MLPVINLRLTDYCRVAFNYCLGLSVPIGHSLWFDRDEVKKTATALHLNLDEYLTALLVSFFQRGNAENHILAFYAAIPGRFALSLCSPETLLSLNVPDISSTFPGCIDLRHDFIPQTAAPFLLSKGGEIFRLHPLPEPDRLAFYVWDFGDYVGNFLKEVDKAHYFRVLNDKHTYFDYAAVPKNPCTSIIYQGAVITVNHVFCQLM